MIAPRTALFTSCTRGFFVVFYPRLSMCYCILAALSFILNISITNGAGFIAYDASLREKVK